jgi:hypothetical protein
MPLTRTKRPNELMIREKGRGLVPAMTHAKEDIAYGMFLDALNLDQSEMQIALAGSQDDRFRKFLSMIGRKRGRATLSLQYCAKFCGIQLHEFMEWALKAENQRALMIAMRRAPRITAKMADIAEEIVEHCERCDGTGVVTAPKGLDLSVPGYRMLGMDENNQEIWVRTCPHGADGLIRRTGSEHAQDRILELAGLINKKGPMVQINQNFGAAHASALADLDAMSLDGESERI